MPRQLSVVGFDDIELAAYTSPPLTTVAQPKEAIGTGAAGLLLERLRDGRTAPRRAILQPAAAPARVHRTPARFKCHDDRSRAQPEGQHMTSSIVVVGSLNMDLVMRMARAPIGGETVPGLDFAMLPGGKGANQAVACARMGANVIMVGRVGIDPNGDVLKAGLAADGVDAREVKGLASTHTGVASIWVEDDGQNRIVLAPGANGLLDPASVARANTMIDMAAMLILQLEVPMPAVQAAIDRAFAAHVPVLLNPAPAAPLPDAHVGQDRHPRAQRERGDRLRRPRRRRPATPRPRPAACCARAAPTACW